MFISNTVENINSLIKRNKKALEKKERKISLLNNSVNNGSKLLFGTEKIFFPIILAVINKNPTNVSDLFNLFVLGK
jgi:hypothetical protein